MASLAFHSSFVPLRQPSFRAWWTTRALPALVAPASLTWTLPSLQSLLDLFPPFLLAVPKKKTSHSKKSMRSANKGLKDKRNIVSCPGCGAAKLAHNLCPSCYSDLNRTWKGKAGKSLGVDLEHSPIGTPLGKFD